MIIPIGDETPRRRFPFVNYAIIIANIAIFVLYMFRPDVEEAEAFVKAYALVPCEWSAKTLITSMFLHGGWAHLVGNMLFLWIAGDNVEDRIGHVPYLFFYFAAGLAGSIAHILTVTGAMDTIPTVGASGAISGVLGAYLFFFPGSKIRFVFWFFVFAKIFKSPSWVAIGFWVALQVLMALDQIQGAVTMVAVFAHLGGFAFGFLTAALLWLVGKEPPPIE